MRSLLVVLSLLMFLVACGGQPTPEEAESEPDVAVQPSATAPSSTDPTAAADEPAAPTEAAEPTEEPTPEPTATTAATETPEPTATTESSPTAEPAAAGMSRSNPAPASDPIDAGNLRVQVLEWHRGDAAAQMVAAANQFNEPAPEGMEYVLVRVQVESLHQDSEEHQVGTIDYALTGANLTEYTSASVVTPEPQLDAQLFTGGTAEGWVPFLVTAGEGSLILVVDELFTMDLAGADRRFIALDEGAAVSVDSALNDVAANDLGVERGSPAPFGEVAITDEYEIQILEVVRGEAALTMAQQANQFNSPPAEGQEYVAVRARVRLLASETSNQPVEVNDAYFRTTGSNNTVHDLPSVVEPEPALRARLYPGGVVEGWTILQAAQGETELAAVFKPLFDLGDENQRFLSLEQP